MSGPLVLSSRSGPVLLLELNRPHRLNAMTRPMVRELVDHLSAAAADPQVRCVVLTGAGRGFCAGGDLADIADVDARVDVNAEVAELRELHRSSRLMHEMPKPVVAAVNGPCAGAGLAWACAADLRIAAHSAVFRTSFVSAGLTGDFGGTWTLPRIVGPARARELYLLNRKVGAREALDIGLVNAVVDDEDLRSSALRTAQELAALPPLAVVGIKQNLNHALTSDFDSALDLEALRQVTTSTSADCGEAARAFLERRPPQFTGR